MVDCLPNDMTQTSSDIGLHRLLTPSVCECLICPTPQYTKGTFIFVKHDQENEEEVNNNPLRTHGF
jgi:hypothetical protein